jgi:carbon storage regulator
MLVLTRKRGQSIVVGGDVEIKILESHGSEVKLGIVAPREVVVLRKEIVEEIERQNKLSIQSEADEGMSLGVIVSAMQRKGDGDKHG